MKKFLALGLILLTTQAVLAAQTTPDSLPGGVYNATPPTLTDQQRGVFQLDNHGQLKISGTITIDTTGLATSALQTTGNGLLSTINTTLGSPMQNSGGTVIVTQGTGTNLHVVCDSGCSSSTSPSYGSAFPSTGTPIGFKDASGNLAPVVLDASGYLPVNVKNSSLAVTGTFWQATQPVSGTFWQATQPVSNGGTFAVQAAQSGTWTVTGAGGTFPVTGTFWQATQPVSGTVTANAGTGTFTVSGTVAATQSGSWSLSANQSVNVAQINGVTPLMGAGNTGTGSPRVTIATDQAALAGMGVGATASAVPANANYIGANTGGNLTGLVACNSVATYDASTSGSTQIVALSGSTVIRICGFNIIAGGTVNVKLVYGTGSNCVTSPSDITPAYQLTAQSGIVDHTPFWNGLQGASANAVCINASGSVAVQAMIYYTRY